MEYLKSFGQKQRKRYCKFLRIQNDPNLIELYKSYHAKNCVWKEITQGMKEVGILDMEIYLHENMLFMIMETSIDFNHQNAMSELANKPRQKEWESIMNQFQNSEADSALAKWTTMERIYEMDQD